MTQPQPEVMKAIAVNPEPLVATAGRMASAVPGLPAQPWPLIGRDEELAAARARLTRDDVRLVTLTGPGGTGKTRLAIEVAAGVVEHFTAGLVLVDLTPALEGRSAIATVAQTLGLGDEADLAALTDALAAQTAERQMLIVLDNFEHVAGAAPALAALLGACPGLTLLVTSREPLRLRWEHEFPVPPLALPDLIGQPEGPALLRSPAVALFVQRAQAVDPAFELDDTTARVVARICTRVDGLPLAIELAASRVKLLPVEEILRRLGGVPGTAARTRLGLLTGGARDLPARQRTMRDTIAWSEAQLDSDERRLFRRLAAFVGGFTLDAAVAVGSPPHAPLGERPAGVAGQPFDDHETSMLAGITSLVDKNLVARQTGKGAAGMPRLAMLQTIREYGLEQLIATGEWDALRRHARYFLELAETAEPHLTEPGRHEWLNRLRDDHQNLLAALEWGLTEDPTGQTGARIAAALWWFWYTQGHARTGREWIERALTAPAAQAPARMRARLLHGAGMLDYRVAGGSGAIARLSSSRAIFTHLEDRRELGRIAVRLGLMHLRECGSGEAAERLARARTWIEEGMACAEAAGDSWGQAAAAFARGVACIADDPRAAAGFLDESVHRYRTLGDDWGTALALSKRGDLAAQEHDYATASASYEAALALGRGEADAPQRVTVLNAVGEAARERGDYALARASYEECLVINRRTDQDDHSAIVLHNLGYVALRQAEVAQAATLFAESAALHRQRASKKGLAECLTGLAAVALCAGHVESAVEFFSAAERYRAQHDLTLCSADQREYDRYRGQAKQRLPAPLFAGAWSAGATRDLEAALDLAVALTSQRHAVEGESVVPAPPAVDEQRLVPLHPSMQAAGGLAATDVPPVASAVHSAASTGTPSASRRRAGGAPADALTPREREVAVLVARGLTNREIAAALMVAERTAANHVNHILTKLNFRTRAQAAVWAAHHLMRGDEATAPMPDAS